jgi:hypothetical protein
MFLQVPKRKYRWHDFLRCLKLFSNLAIIAVKWWVKFFLIIIKEIRLTSAINPSISIKRNFRTGIIKDLPRFEWILFMMRNS